MTTQFDPNDPARFEEMYRDERVTHGLPAATPWDIGGPQPVVQQLVAFGGVHTLPLTSSFTAWRDADP